MPGRAVRPDRAQSPVESSQQCSNHRRESEFPWARIRLAAAHSLKLARAHSVRIKPDRRLQLRRPATPLVSASADFATAGPEVCARLSRSHANALNVRLATDVFYRNRDTSAHAKCFAHAHTHANSNAHQYADNKPFSMPSPSLSYIAARTDRGRPLKGPLATDVLLPLLIMARRKRSRGLIRKRSTRGSKQRPTAPRKPKSTVPPEMRAPMTTDVEQQLRALIRRHGAKKIHDALVPLLAKCKLNDWLCVANAVERLARKGARVQR